MEKVIIKKICVVIAFMMSVALQMAAQNLVAAQANVYFGSPKKLTVTNSQGTTVTEFDRNGRVTREAQGNMSVRYEWSDDGREVTMSMYQGDNFQDHAHVNIEENTPSRLKYVIGDMLTVDIVFRSNKSVGKIDMTNPQMSATSTYIYNNDNDMYPCAIEQSFGNQSVKMSVTVNETDSYGNATMITQELMGNKDVTKRTIEYY